MATDVEQLQRLRGQNLSSLSLNELVLLQVHAHQGLAGIQLAVTEAVDRLGEQGVQVCGIRQVFWGVCMRAGSGVGTAQTHGSMHCADTRPTCMPVCVPTPRIP